MRKSLCIVLAGAAGALNAQVTCDSVNTLYDYTYLNHGAMFNVVAFAPVTLNHITANLNWGTADFTLYYRNGPFQGHEGNSADWTTLGTATVTSNNTQTDSDNPTMIPIGLNLPVEPGDTIAFYLTSSPVSKVFLTATTMPWGTPYASDAFISVSVARSIYQSFGTPFSTPQIWNGSVIYCTSGTTGIDNTPASGVVSIHSLEPYVIVEFGGDAAPAGVGITMYDLSGRAVLRTSAQPGRTVLDTRTLISGSYLVQVQDQGTTLLTRKVYIP